MGRPKQYDRETVLRRAYEAFWAKGYEATTMQDLLDHMALNRGSLYADFADKRALFLECLGQYREEIVQQRLDAMAQAATARAGIEGFFAALIAQCQSKRGSPGCLATNTAAELAGRDPVIGAEIAAGLRRVEDVFADTLRRGIAAGEFSAGLPVRPIARYLVGLAQGVNVLNRVLPDVEYLREVVTTGLQVLDRVPAR